MAAVRRPLEVAPPPFSRETPSSAPAVEGPRAKTLRPRAEVRSETRAALADYERCARNFELLDDGKVERLDMNVDARTLRTAATRVMNELVRELTTGALPPPLASDVERWDEGQFAGSDVDVEVANHAIFALMGANARPSLA